jgi:hypothetical protein
VACLSWEFRMINFGLRAEEYFVTSETRLRYNVQVHKISLFKKYILVYVQKSSYREQIFIPYSQDLTTGFILSQVWYALIVCFSKIHFNIFLASTLINLKKHSLHVLLIQTV